MTLAALQGADTILFLVSTIVGISGLLGVAYTIFRSAAQQKVAELNKQIIDNQQLILAQQEAEVIKERQLRIAAEQSADSFRESLTQKAAVDHLAEVLVREEGKRFEEHQRQAEMHETMVMLLKDIVAQLKGARGSLG